MIETCWHSFILLIAVNRLPLLRSNRYKWPITVKFCWLTGADGTKNCHINSFSGCQLPLKLPSFVSLTEQNWFTETSDDPLHWTHFIWSPFYWRINLIPACISNYISDRVWDEITSPFPNFNGATVEVWECISNFLLGMWSLIHAGIEIKPC